jgi:hypothetical protein
VAGGMGWWHIIVVVVPSYFVMRTLPSVLVHNYQLVTVRVFTESSYPWKISLRNTVYEGYSVDRERPNFSFS